MRLMRRGPTVVLVGAVVEEFLVGGVVVGGGGVKRTSPQTEWHPCETMYLCKLTRFYS